MTILLLTILCLFAAVILVSNLYPKIQHKYPWFLTIPIYVTGIISYIMLLWMILLHNRDFQLNAAFNWISLDLNSLWLEFKIDNQTILLLTIISTIFILRHIYFKNRISGIASESKLHYANSTNALLLAGSITLMSDSLLLITVAQIIFSLTLYYRFLELNKDSGDQSPGSVHFLWLIFFDMLFILAVMLIFAQSKLLTISTLSRLNLNESNSPLLNQIAKSLMILSLFGKAAQVPFHKWFIASSSWKKSAPEKSFSLESLIIIMSVLLKLNPLLSPECRLFTLVIGFIGTLLALSAAVIHQDRESIFNYLLIAQTGLFLIIFGAGFNSLLLVYIITFSWSNLLLQLSLISGNQLSSKRTSYFLTTTTIIGILAIIGFPLTAAFCSKIIIFQNLISQAQLNPICWLTLVLFSLVYLSLIFNLFRLFFTGINDRAPLNLDNPARLSLSQRSIISILVLLNFYFLYSIPEYNPFTTKSWLDDFLPSPLQINPDIAVNLISVIGLIILFQILSFLMTLLIYYFKDIDTNRLRLTFRSTEKFIHLLTDPNPVAIQKITSITNQIAAGIHKFEDQLPNQFANRIITSILRTRNKVVKLNNQFVEAYPSEKMIIQKLLSKLVRSFYDRELFFFLTVLAIFILIIILSIL
jgi:formate hydrogenlyase subunit 3/multisubunit Na+/H+ antiporter MnhD subunit